MADRKVFSDSVVPLPDHSGVTPHGLMVNLAEAPDTTQAMPLLFSLGLAEDQQAALEAAAASGKRLDRKQIAEGFGPSQAAVDNLVTWLKQNGYQIDHVPPDRSGVYATAPISQIQSSLQVKIVPVTKDGVTYAGAQNAPSLPADVGAPVTAIVGLQPYRRPHKHFRAAARRRNRSRLAPDGSATPNIANEPPYFPSELLRAYGGAASGLTGKGQTIAILIDTAPSKADLEAFWKAAGVPADFSRIDVINVSGDSLPPQEGEETLDVSWTSGIAPDAAIRVYCAGELSFTALDLALDAIIADLPSVDGLNQVSISLGLGETFFGGPNGEVATQHQKFLKLAAAGVNVFVSTGDAGSNPDQTGHSPTGPLQAEYESSDTSVIAVGGTSLELARDGSIASETAWASGGGGRSVLFKRPAWQQGPGVPAGADRLVPDVCAAADPNTGAFLVLHGKPTAIGGTSWSAPVWAGLCALLNQARVNAGEQPLAYLNPLLYPLGGANGFHDVTSGSNGAYHAGTGYDLVTGLGSPNLAALLASLATAGAGATRAAPQVAPVE